VPRADRNSAGIADSPRRRPACGGSCDFIAIRAFSIPYESLFSHRGFFHSPFSLILFAAVAAGIVTRGHSRKAFALLWLVWAGRMVTHPLLDALTGGGRGVMLLLPFTRAKFFFPWRPLYTPPGNIENILPYLYVIRGDRYRRTTRAKTPYGCWHMTVRRCGR
jgi:hypothetical protein